MSDSNFRPANRLPVPRISSLIQDWWWSGDVALPASIDDAERDFGLDIYDRMLNDPVIGGVVDGLRMATLSEGLSVEPCIPKPDERFATAEELASYELAERVANYVKAAFDAMEPSGQTIIDACFDLLLAISHGHRLAEAATKISEEGEFAGLEVFDSIRCKPRRNYAFVVDNAFRFRGVVALQPGGHSLIWQGIIPRLEALSNAVDPEKLVLLTLNPKDGNPQGRSWLRSAYAPWKEKQIGRVEDVKNIGAHGGGKVSAIMPERVQTPADQHPEQEFLSNLEQFTNGAATVFPHGTELAVHYPPNDGPFDAFLDRRDREIVLAIAKQIRSTLEAKHSSKADSQTAQDKEDGVIKFLRRNLVESLRRLIRPLVRRNLGPEAAALLPSLVFSGADSGDFASNLEALAKVGYTLDASQFEGWDQKLGMPRRDPDWRERAESTPTDPKKPGGSTPPDDEDDTDE